MQLPTCDTLATTSAKAAVSDDTAFFAENSGARWWWSGSTSVGEDLNASGERSQPGEGCCSDNTIEGEKERHTSVPSCSEGECCSCPLGSKCNRSSSSERSSKSSDRSERSSERTSKNPTTDATAVGGGTSVVSGGSSNEQHEDAEEASSARAAHGVELTLDKGKMRSGQMQQLRFPYVELPRPNTKSQVILEAAATVEEFAGTILTSSKSEYCASSTERQAAYKERKQEGIHQIELQKQTQEELPMQQELCRVEKTERISTTAAENCCTAACTASAQWQLLRSPAQEKPGSPKTAAETSSSSTCVSPCSISSGALCCSSLLHSPAQHTRSPEQRSTNNSSNDDDVLAAWPDFRSPQQQRYVTGLAPRLKKRNSNGSKEVIPGRARTTGDDVYNEMLRHMERQLQKQFQLNRSTADEHLLPLLLAEQAHQVTGCTKAQPLANDTVCSESGRRQLLKQRLSVEICVDSSNPEAVAKQKAEKRLLLLQQQMQSEEHASTGCCSTIVPPGAMATKSALHSLRKLESKSFTGTEQHLQQLTKMTAATHDGSDQCSSSILQKRLDDRTARGGGTRGADIELQRLLLLLQGYGGGTELGPEETAASVTESTWKQSAAMYAVSAKEKAECNSELAEWDDDQSGTFQQQDLAALLHGAPEAETESDSRIAQLMDQRNLPNEDEQQQPRLEYSTPKICCRGWHEASPRLWIHTETTTSARRGSSTVSTIEELEDKRFNCVAKCSGSSLLRTTAAEEVLAHRVEQTDGEAQPSKRGQTSLVLRKVLAVDQTAAGDDGTHDALCSGWPDATASSSSTSAHPRKSNSSRSSLLEMSKHDALADVKPPTTSTLPHTAASETMWRHVLAAEDEPPADTQAAAARETIVTALESAAAELLERQHMAATTAEAAGREKQAEKQRIDAAALLLQLLVATAKHDRGGECLQELLLLQQRKHKSASARIISDNGGASRDKEFEGSVEEERNKISSRIPPAGSPPAAPKSTEIQCASETMMRGASDILSENATPKDGRRDCSIHQPRFQDVAGSVLDSSISSNCKTAATRFPSCNEALLQHLLYQHRDSKTFLKAKQQGRPKEAADENRAQQIMRGKLTFLQSLMKGQQQKQRHREDDESRLFSDERPAKRMRDHPVLPVPAVAASGVRTVPYCTIESSIDLNSLLSNIKEKRSNDSSQMRCVGDRTSLQTSLSKDGAVSKVSVQQQKVPEATALVSDSCNMDSGNAFSKHNGSSIANNKELLRTRPPLNEVHSREIKNQFQSSAAHRTANVTGGCDSSSILEQHLRRSATALNNDMRPELLQQKFLTKSSITEWGNSRVSASLREQHESQNLLQTPRRDSSIGFQSCCRSCRKEQAPAPHDGGREASSMRWENDAESDGEIFVERDGTGNIYKSSKSAIADMNSVLGPCRRNWQPGDRRSEGANSRSTASVRDVLLHQHPKEVVRGVYFDATNQAWAANMRVKGRVQKKSFSLKRYGSQAREKAIEARIEMEKDFGKTSARDLPHQAPHELTSSPLFVRQTRSSSEGYCGESCKHYNGVYSKNGSSCYNAAACGSSQGRHDGDVIRDSKSSNITPTQSASSAFQKSGSGVQYLLYNKEVQEIPQIDSRLNPDKISMSNTSNTNVSTEKSASNNRFSLQSGSEKRPCASVQHRSAESLEVASDQNVAAANLP